MGCSVGEYNMNARELEDKTWIRKCEKKETLEEERSRGRSVIEKGKAGKNKLWKRKVWCKPARRTTLVARSKNGVV